MKTKKQVRRAIDRDYCPEGMAIAEWQRKLRENAAAKEAFSVTPVAAHWSHNAYTVAGGRSRRAYRVVYYGPGSPYNSCQCMDFRTNSLGTCKHIEAVRRKGVRVSPAPRRSVLDVCYTGGRHIRLRLDSADKAIGMAAMRYFDDEMFAVRGMIAELPVFIEAARKANPSFHCTDDALNLILEERDRLRRIGIIDSITDDEIGGALRTRLYPYQIEGIRFAFRAGRSLNADEMGLGKTVQAIGTSELLRARNMVSSVLVVCPTSLKYQWKKEIERFTGASVTVIEGIHTRRRELYADAADYKIVSYHTLANDIKAMGSVAVDMLIMDEVQRLKNWNTQISQAARRIESDYAVVLSGTPLENKVEELYSVMQFVDQYALGPYHEFMEHAVVRSETGKVTGYKGLNEIGARLSSCMIRRRKADVALQMPERTDKTLFVPMTKEQRAVHDEAVVVVAQLVAKWQRHHFLSEKDRKRLLLLMSRMRMVCDSTFIVDLKTRFDTKVSETIELIRALVENGPEKAVVFSQWERMTRLICQELENAGIAYEYLHGSVPSAKRGDICERFAANPDVRVFVSTDAGSTGLNLQAASTVINVDLPWNPAILEQRIARVYRIGQGRRVQVVNLVSAGTIEERMLTTLNFKQNLFAGILDGGDDRITLDDAKLTRVAEGLTTILDQSQLTEDGENGTLIAAADTEAAEQPQAAAEQSETDPAELVRSGMTFLSGLARTLSSEEATRKLVDIIVRTDPDTGNTVVQLPVESKESVVNLLGALARLIK